MGEGQKAAGRTYITEEGLQRLREEFDHLWRVERPRVTLEVAAAADLGDRSENAEYIYGKRRLREIDERLQFLSERMGSVVVAGRSVARDGRVTFGAWVTVEDEDGATFSYRLVGPDEANAAIGFISIESPVGRALLGRRTDDEVEVARPKGSCVLTITDVRYEPPV